MSLIMATVNHFSLSRVPKSTWSKKQSEEDHLLSRTSTPPEPSSPSWTKFPVLHRNSGGGRSTRPPPPSISSTYLWLDSVQKPFLCFSFSFFCSSRWRINPGAVTLGGHASARKTQHLQALKSALISPPTGHSWFSRAPLCSAYGIVVCYCVSKLDLSCNLLLCFLFWLYRPSVGFTSPLWPLPALVGFVVPELFGVFIGFSSRCLLCLATDLSAQHWVFVISRSMLGPASLCFSDLVCLDS